MNAELSEKGSKIRVNSVHPGGIRTGLQSSLSQEEMAAMGWLDKDGKVSPAFKSVEQGASTSTWVSVSPEMAPGAWDFFGLFFFATDEV